MEPHWVINLKRCWLSSWTAGNIHIGLKVLRDFFFKWENNLLLKIHSIFYLSYLSGKLLDFFFFPMNFQKTFLLVSASTMETGLEYSVTLNFNCQIESKIL